jgi:hypothetical protein
MADDLIKRQAATYKPSTERPPTHMSPAPSAAGPAPRPLSQTERQALTYAKQPKDAAAFKKFTQDTGLSEAQAHAVIDWLTADEKGTQR